VKTYLKMLGFLNALNLKQMHNKGLTRFEKSAEIPVNTEKFIFMGL
jgi:hypothetical protein